MSAPVFIALILGGIVVLLFGGDYLVRGGAGLARRWKLPSLFVGLTIVAFGTSAPELVVSVQSALAGAPGLAMGNIVGSNIANFLLVLGLPAVFGAIATTTPGVGDVGEFLLLLGAVVMFIAGCLQRESRRFLRTSPGANLDVIGRSRRPCRGAGAQGKRACPAGGHRIAPEADLVSRWSDNPCQ